MASKRPSRAEVFDDGVSDERRAAAVAHLQASFAKERERADARQAEQSRPALSEKERAAREGFATLPITPEIRAMLANADGGLTAQRQRLLLVLALLVGVEAVTFGLGGLLTGDLTILALFVAITAVGVGLLLLGRRATQTWLPQRDAARAAALQSYYRYAGLCAIGEIHTSTSGDTDFFYPVQLASPPAPPELAALTFGNWERHQDWVGSQWRTLEFVVTKPGPKSAPGRSLMRVLRVLAALVTFYAPLSAAGVVQGTVITLRDDHDRTVYDYEEG